MNFLIRNVNDNHFVFVSKCLWAKMIFYLVVHVVEEVIDFVSHHSLLIRVLEIVSAIEMMFVLERAWNVLLVICHQNHILDHHDLFYYLGDYDSRVLAVFLNVLIELEEIETFFFENHHNFVVDDYETKNNFDTTNAMQLVTLLNDCYGNAMKLNVMEANDAFAVTTIC